MQKKNIRIAIPTNNGKTIFSGMLGRAKYFYVYKMSPEGQSICIDKRKNPYETSLQHLKTLDVYEVIHDCSIIIAHKIGKKGIERLKERGVVLYFMHGTINDAFHSF